MLSLTSRSHESVHHFFSRVLAGPAIAQASMEAQRNLYQLEPFEQAYKTELGRVTDMTKPIKVEVPNYPESKTLYSVASVTPADVERHFAGLTATMTPAETVHALEELLGNFDRAKVTALISLWGTKTFPDAGHEVEEVSALLHLMKHSVSAADGDVLVRNFPGNGKTALVLPATNFPLLALKDAVWLLMQGYRVVLGVQPRYWRLYEDVLGFMPSATRPDKQMVSMLPLLTRQNEAALERSVQLAETFRFTGNSKLFKKLYGIGLKANRRFDAGGEISGINRTVLDESVTVLAGASAPAVQENAVVVEGLHWSITANNGELCSSTSMVESSLDAAQIGRLTEALYKRDKTPGMYGDYKSGKLLVRKDKQAALKLLPETGEVREYWDKTAMFVPRGFGDTFNSLTHCVYAASLAQALRSAVKSHASNLYVCAAPVAGGSSLARVGTTGAKIPESVFGSMRSYTNSVGGNHDGVGTSQWLLNLVRTRANGGRQARLSHSLPEELEQLCDFISDAKKRQHFVDERLPEILDVLYFFAAHPEVHGPYAGQPLVNGQGSSTVVSLKAVRSSLKQFLVRGSTAAADQQLDQLVQYLVVEALSPWRASRTPLLHVLSANGALRSFLRFVEKHDLAQIVEHADPASLVNHVKADPLPPFFHGVGDRTSESLPDAFIAAVGERAGFLYERMARDPLAVFREVTTSQAWACGVQPEAVEEAKQLLLQVYEAECFKPQWRPLVLHVNPTVQDQEEAMEQEGGKSP